MQNLIVFIAGQKGSGKTTLALRIAEDAPRVTALDTMGQYGGEHGFEVHYGLGPCVKALLATRGAETFKVSCRLEHKDDFLQLARLCYELPRQLVIIEETSMYCSPHTLPDELSTLIRYGRHREIDQLYIARRPFEIHREITANADVGVTFVQFEPNDVRYLCAVAGPEAARVVTLGEYRALVWGDTARAPLAAIAAADIVLDRRSLYRGASGLSDDRPVESDESPAPEGAPA